MKRTFFFVAAAVLIASAQAQIRCISLDFEGKLTWTNSLARGFYRVESAGSAAGPWDLCATAADLDAAVTNPMAVQVPLTSSPSFYRVAWVRPDPVGLWDYQGYDRQGTLVITGQLSIPSMTLSSSNTSDAVYDLQGTWELQYAGPETNAVWWLGPQIGTGWFGGTLSAGYAVLALWWPTNSVDNNIDLNGTLLGNTYTGRWIYTSWAGPFNGPFNAVRMTSTNSATVNRFTGPGPPIPRRE